MRIKIFTFLILLVAAGGGVVIKQLEFPIWVGLLWILIMSGLAYWYFKTRA